MAPGDLLDGLPAHRDQGHCELAPGGRVCCQVHGQGAGAAGDARSLVNGTCLTGQAQGQKGESPSIGHCWGVFNRKALPWGERQTAQLKPGPWLEEAKELGRSEWPGVNEYRGYGYTLFVDEPGTWVEAMRFLAEGGAR